ncbi:MAG: protease complex subunit PrcB family protein [Christensenellales bacterium]|jgi:hypothetical protein
MKRRVALLLFIVMLTLALFALAGCAGSGIPFETAVKRNKLDFTGAKLDIFFRSEMTGGNEIKASWSGADAKRMVDALYYSVPVKQPEEAYSPSLCCSQQLQFVLSDSSVHNVYYDAEKNRVTFEIEKTSKSGAVIKDYLFYEPDPVFVAILESARRNALATDKQNEKNIETSLLVLRAKITDEMLQAEGEYVPHKLYNGNYAYVEEEPFYHVFTKEEMPELEEDQAMLVASVGKQEKTGWEIEITSIEKTDELVRIKVVIVEPNEYSGMVEEAVNYPFAVAICDVEDFPPDKIIVFVQDDGEGGAGAILAVQQMQEPS